MRRSPIDAKPRGPCSTCNQGFSPATERQWAQRWSAHLMWSERHKKYVALASKPLARVLLRAAHSTAV